MDFIREAKGRDGVSNLGDIWRKKSCESGFGGDTEQTLARTRAFQGERTAWTHAWRLEKAASDPEQGLTFGGGVSMCVDQ